MDLTDSASYTWKIADFAKLSSANYKLSSHDTCDNSRIDCKQATFSLGIELDRQPVDFSLDDHCKISLFRTWSRDDPDLTVLWKIWLINQNGDECLSRVIETGFSTKSKCYPIFGGLYMIDQKFILKKSNRLLTDGSLIIKCQVTVLCKSLQIDLNNSNIMAMKALEDYESLLESSKHSDVVFVVGKDKKEFKLHTQILSARSPVFSRMFDHSDFVENKQNRVEITDIEVEVFEQLLHFIYGGKVSSLDKYAADLLVAAEKYQLESLKQICEQSLSTNITSLTVDNVAAVLTLADMANAAELKSKCIEFITANASKLVDSEAYKQMAMNNVGLLMELYRDMVVRHNNKKQKTKK